MFPAPEPFSNREMLTNGAMTQFQKIYILSMPERTDKQDSIAMGASFSGFTFEWLKGVKGSEIPDKALPKERTYFSSIDNDCS